jgi:hypothetical protein
MENLTEFWKNVKERISNPFIFSFIILWFVYNWKITLGIFLLDSNDFRLTGNLTLIDYLEGQIKYIVFWKPIVFAILYCLFVPVIKELLRAFNAVVNRYGSDLYFRISKDSKVDFELYTQQIRDLDHNKKEIDTLLKDARTKDQERQAASAELVIVKQRLQEMERNYQEQLETTNRMRDVKVLNGAYSVVRDGREHQDTFRVEIQNGLYKETTSNDSSAIEGFFFDNRNKAIVFARKNQDKNAKSQHLFYVLTRESDQYLSGTENDYPISFTLDNTVRKARTPEERIRERDNKTL